MSTPVLGTPTNESRKVFSTNCETAFHSVTNAYVTITHLMAEAGFWATADQSCTEPNLVLAFIQTNKPADLPFAKAWFCQFFPLVVVKKDTKFMVNGSEVVVKNCLKFSLAAYTTEHKGARPLDLYQSAITNRFDLFTSRKVKADKATEAASKWTEDKLKTELEKADKAAKKRMADIAEKAAESGLTMPEPEAPVAEALPSIRQVIKTLQKADLSNIAPEERILFDTLLAAVVSHKISLS